MMYPLIVSLVTGGALLVACFALVLWQILSAPDRPNYPTSGAFKRTVMFWFAAALLYWGAEILSSALGPTPVVVSDGLFVASVLLAVLMMTFLVDHIRHWLPVRTHARIRRLLAIARCQPSKGLIAARRSAMVSSTGKPCPSADVVGPALVSLSLDGAHVAGPNAGPEAFTR